MKNAENIRRADREKFRHNEFSTNADAKKNNREISRAEWTGWMRNDAFRKIKCCSCLLWVFESFLANSRSHLDKSTDASLEWFARSVDDNAKLVAKKAGRRLKSLAAFDWQLNYFSRPSPSAIDNVSCRENDKFRELTSGSLLEFGAPLRPELARFLTKDDRREDPRVRNWILLTVS